MTAPKYKIVYCTPALYSAGGVERIVTVKANYFADILGYDVTIIVTEGNGVESFFPLSEKVHVCNLGIHFEEIWNVPFIKKVWLYLTKQRLYKKALSYKLQEIRPDITISTLRREVNFITKIKDGSLKIGELHLNRTNFRELENRKYNFVLGLFAKWWKCNLVAHLKRLDKFVVLTETSMGEWPELHNMKMIPDPLPIQVNHVSNLDVKRVISIGRYSYEKGNDLLLKAWAKVEKSCDEWVLDIYGMGDQTPYRQLIKELGIDTNRCHLHGSLSNVVDEYLNSSIFALPSRFEGFGLVIIEAMSCGLPVVTFNCENGPRNIITDGENGCLIRPFDVDAYANQLIRLIQDADLRQTIGANAHVTSGHFAIDDIANQWKKLFDELMQGR